MSGKLVIHNNLSVDISVAVTTSTGTPGSSGVAKTFNIKAGATDSWTRNGTETVFAGPYSSDRLRTYRGTLDKTLEIQPYDFTF
ncbi:hypothetical protein CPB83DRAFT_851664 [Crepidotus variabilis]|uniref:Uncharacterized protein n=1 Tax=Crepidotus variabilis TaxID=179855 RepID=A0A9P6EHN5_9AGAR|nr:hypothetical protein CPB83DRAFT_851664 [Crepidotus variabilis]